MTLRSGTSAGDRPATIRLEDVHHSFGDVSVLDGVDLAVDPGEFVALVGPNGAGKTTLLRTINGILSPDRGRVLLDGDATNELSPKAISRRVATVPQDTHVGFSFTAEQIVEMGRTPHRSRLDWSEDTDPVEEALERVDMLDLRDRAVDDLSGGERQRVLLARALAQKADALLLDEPTASLDINHQVRVLDLVEALVAEGKTALAAIHDLDLAARYCDRLVLLADGRIRASGPPGDVLTDGELANAFGATTAVTRNPATGTPTVSAFADRPDREATVHVAGSGVAGQRTLATLWRAGFDLTAGPVPEGDAALTIADRIDCVTVTAPPFSELGDGAREETAALAREADVVVVTTGPSGDAIAEAVQCTPRIRAALGQEVPEATAERARARGDGGVGAVAVDRIVETEDELLAAVEACLDWE